MELTGGAGAETDEIEDKYEQLQGVDSNEHDNEYTLLECHCYLDIEEFRTPTSRVKLRTSNCRT